MWNGETHRYPKRERRERLTEVREKERGRPTEDREGERERVSE